MKKFYILALLTIYGHSTASELPPCPTTEALVSEMVKQYQGSPNEKQIKQTMKNRMTNCFGSSAFITGMQYIGEWKNGEMSGQGTSIDSNKNKYTGYFNNGLKEGVGAIEFSNGSSYSGEWLKGEPYGKGTFISKTGENYTGNFKGSQWHGQGTLTLVNGTKFSGLWFKSEFVPSICEKAGIPQNDPEHSKCILRYMDKIDRDL